MSAQDKIDRLESYVERIRDLDPALRAEMLRLLEELRALQK
jgi:hypothetical protein